MSTGRSTPFSCGFFLFLGCFLGFPLRSTEGLRGFLYPRRGSRNGAGAVIGVELVLLATAPLAGIPAGVAVTGETIDCLLIVGENSSRGHLVARPSTSRSNATGTRCAEPNRPDATRCRRGSPAARRDGHRLLPASPSQNRAYSGECRRPYHRRAEYRSGALSHHDPLSPGCLPLESGE